MYICFQGISTSTFYGTRKREVASVVLPPDGSYSNEGTSEDEEDDLYTEGQCQDSSSSSDQFSDSSSDDEAEEGANQSKSGRMFR